MTKKEITINAIAALEGLYPDAICSLEYTDAFQLLIATRLSAQCTDARVNMVTPALFNRYPDAKSMAVAEISDVEELIKTCGLYKTKARDLVGIAQKIMTDFGGNVPDTIEALTILPGVGRKTANLVCGDIYGKPAVVTDTHFIRLCNRLGLVKTTNPLQVEMAMRKLLPPEKSNDFCHRSVLFGRDICTARKAYCERCPLNSFCPKKIDKK
ncbi:MAG: endonuclease III [Acutalibacteraceae bacterium]|nr:endonuclease III [Acutalibacteraceae bacterium]